VEGEKNITKLANHNCPCNSNAAAIAQSYGLVFSKSFLLTNMQEVSLSSPPSRKNALSPLLLHQLIQDIDSNGGIDLISVRNLCNRKVDIYGTPGSQSSKVCAESSSSMEDNEKRSVSESAN
jgi:hypothetical protein